jgi:omega-amidase
MTNSNNLIVSLIQSDITWENKTTNLNNFKNQILSIQEDTDLIILPEMFSTGFTMSPNDLAEDMDGESVNWMKEMAKTKDAYITGSLIITENQKFYNRLLFVSPDGEISYYDKKHLFSYAGEDKNYTAGDKRVIVNIKGWRINLQICYDLRFPVFSRNRGDYDLLLYVANWPFSRRLAWTTLLQARSIENQSYVIGVNRIGKDPKNQYGGDSIIYNPLGEIIYHKRIYQGIKTIGLSKQFIDRFREDFPFLKDGDEFELNPHPSFSLLEL